MNADLIKYTTPFWTENEISGEELAHLTRVSRKDLWETDMRSLPAHAIVGLPQVDWYWAQYDWRGVMVLVPSATWYQRVLTSRNFPVVTLSEQERLRQTTVIIAGLSVGRSVATQLARFGVEHFVLFDGDWLAPANMNRLHGASICDLGLSKVESVSREILEINPWAQIEGAVSKLTGDGLSSILKTRNNVVVVEMIDDIQAKVDLRLAARKYHVPLLMATDIDWDPMVDIEIPGQPLFGGRISPKEIDDLVGGESSFEHRTALAMRVMSPPRWPPRSLAGGQLARMGKLHFWPQIGPCAAATAALAVRVVFDLVRGAADIPDRAYFSISDAIGTIDPVDETDELMACLSTPLASNSK